MAATPTSALSFQNFFSTALTSDITASATDIFLDNIPNGTEGFLVIDPDTSSREVIFYTSKTATKVVCPSEADGRGQDDTSASTHLQGTTVIMAPVAAYFEALVSLFTTTPQGWSSLAGTFTSNVYNGNRSYTFSTSVDQTSIVSRGMRGRGARGTIAPTQCTDLEASSSQYYSKTTPNKLTFTDDFVVSAWVKLESYGIVNGIASRFNGTSGWVFRVDTDGTVQLLGYNAGGANFSRVRTYQSIPLNKWVHVSAQLDMSSFTATTTTSYVMIDGVNIPAYVDRGGTNPTALVQAGDLNVGAVNGGTTFDGKIAQVAIYSAKVTQANIAATISQGLSGSETNLASAYSFNNSILDLNTTTPNDLTAQGSAVATNADSPFTQNDKGVPGGTYDHFIVTDVTSTTMTVQVPEGNALPTSGTISSMAYSTFKAPYGMPVDAGKWQVSSYFRKTSTATTSNATYGSFDSGGWTLTVPVGGWSVGWRAGVIYNSTTTGVAFNISRTALTGLSISAGADVSPYVVRVVSSAAAVFAVSCYVENQELLSTASTYVMYTIGATTGGGIDAGSGVAEIFAKFNLL